MFGCVLAALVWCVAFAVFKSRKGTPYKEVLWGRVYKRQRTTVKAEIQKLSVSQDGGSGCIDILIPSIKGCVSIPVEQARLDDIAKKIDIKDIESEEGSRTKVLLSLMQIGEKTYIAKIPSGNMFYLGNAVILKNKVKKDEYELSELNSVEDRIKSVLYNRNAILICGAIAVFVNPLISVLCSVVSTYLSLKNIPFSSKDKDSFGGWEVVDTQNYPKAVQSKNSSDGRLLTKTEQTINEIKQSIGPKIPCPNCGVLLMGEDWQYCPHCGVSLSGETSEDSIDKDIHQEEPETGFEPPEDDSVLQDESFSDMDLEYPAEEIDGALMDEEYEPDMEVGQDMQDDAQSKAEEFDPESAEDDIELLDVDDISSLDSDDDDIEPMGAIIEGDFREVSNMAREFSKNQKNKK